MTNEEKIKRVKVFLGIAVDDNETVVGEVIEEYLSIADDTIKVTRYPFKVPEDYVIEPQFEPIQCELAARYFVRRGGLGEVIHNENGINRTWYSSDDRELLSKITPIAKLV